VSTHLIRFASRNVLLGAAAALFAAFGATGCYATVEARPGVVAYEDGPIVWVDRAPAYIETYPCEYYGGTQVYLVDGRWYYRSADRWAYYRSAPVALERRRVVLEQSWHRPVAAYPHAHVEVHVDGRVHSAPQPRVVVPPRIERRVPARPRVQARR
jgi:hypothetical protein